MIQVYTKRQSTRLKYVAIFILETILKEKVEFIDDDGNLENKLPVIWYDSSEPTNGSYLQIRPHEFIVEKGVSDHSIQVDEWKDHPIFFKTSDEGFPFDIFSASFYLISRYEEYLPHKTDKHERFSAEQSIAFQHNFLKRPLVDEWAYLLQNEIKSLNPNWNPATRKFKYVSTVDVDTAFAFKGKGVIRTTGALLRDAAFFDTEAVKERVRVIAGADTDPYDVFQYLIDLKEEFDHPMIFFFLLGDYDVNDKNIPHWSPAFRSIIKHVNDYALTAIHPSYASTTDSSKILTEIKRLKNITHMPITKSRQHFLKIQLPKTYRNLIEADIQDDYSMAYASHSGFRASTCTPFRFYDLDLELETDLRVHSFPLMEATYKYYKHQTPDQALELMKPIVDKVKAVNGILYTTWHNDSLSEHGEWKGWRKLYEQLLKYIHEA